MAISEIWTISGPVSGTLANLSVESAVIEFRAGGTDYADLTFNDPAHAATAWARGTAVTILRSGSVFFKGKVAQSPRAAQASGDSRTVRIEGPWSDLRLPYSQDWKHWNGSAVATQTEHPRVIVGKSADGLYSNTTAALTEILTYAEAKGVNLTLGTTPTARQVPLIETHSRSCADILGQTMRWHWDAIAAVDYSTTPPTLDVTPTASLSNLTLPAADYPSDAYQLAKRDDLVPSGVILSYEAYAKDTDANSTQRYRRQIYRDTAGNTTVGPDTLLAVMPVQIEGLSTPTRREQELLTQAIPGNGTTGNTTEAWWIEHSPLERWGIGVGDLALTSANVGDIHAHTITAVPLPDPATLGEDVEIPSFWTDNLDDLDREILSGQVHEWMPGIYYGRVRARATLAIRKTVIDALPIEKRLEALRICRPDVVTLSGGFAAYLLDMEVIVAATNGLSRTYRETGFLALGNGTLPAVGDQIIPGLAAAYYAMISTARWEGQITLTHDEAGATRYLGNKINLSGGRSEWASMAALVQIERIDLATGQTRLTLGAPSHLSLTDFAELMRIARAPQERREITLVGTEDPDAATAPAWGDGRAAKVTGAAMGPMMSTLSIPPEFPRRWVPYGNGTATVLRVGKVWAGEAAVNATAISNTATALSVVAGGGVWLKVGGVSVANVTLESGGTLPEPFLVDDSGNLTYYHKILGDFSSTDPGPPGFPIGDGSIYYRPRVGDSDLVAVSTVFEPTGNVANATQGVMLVPC